MPVQWNLARAVLPRTHVRTGEGEGSALPYERLEGRGAWLGHGQAMVLARALQSGLALVCCAESCLAVDGGVASGGGRCATYPGRDHAAECEVRLFA
jgi:hypothetical protein